MTDDTERMPRKSVADAGASTDCRRLLSRKDAAAYLGISTRTFDALRNQLGGISYLTGVSIETLTKRYAHATRVARH
jgi:hypothetical protein